MSKPPPCPPQVSPSNFGHYVMRWGSGKEPALARKSTLTAAELRHAGMTLDCARMWLDFYVEYIERKEAEGADLEVLNPSALGRAELMRYACNLLQENNP